MGLNANRERAEEEMRSKWLKIWSKVEARFAVLPEWAQDLLLDDITTAIQSRIAIMYGAQETAAA